MLVPSNFWDQLSSRLLESPQNFTMNFQNFWGGRQTFYPTSSQLLKPKKLVLGPVGPRTAEQLEWLSDANLAQCQDAEA